MANIQAKGELRAALESIDRHERAERFLENPTLPTVFPNNGAKLDMQWGRGAGDDVAFHTAKDLLEAEIEACWGQLLDQAKRKAAAKVKEQTEQAKNWAAKL